MARRKQKPDDISDGAGLLVVIVLLILAWVYSVVRAFYESLPTVNPCLTVIVFVIIVVFLFLVIKLVNRLVSIYVT